MNYTPTLEDQAKTNEEIMYEEFQKIESYISDIQNYSAGDQDE